MSDPLQLRLTPYDYQVKGIEFALAKRYSIIGDQMGLGKSLQALGLAVAAQASNVLIVCPTFLVFNWKAEIEKFLGKEALDAFTVVSYDNLRKIGTMKGYDVVIGDECFVAGTKVDTPAGPREVETILPGDFVLSAAGRDVVEAVSVSVASETILVNDMECTPNHPFLTERGWVEAKSLRVGEVLIATSEAMRLVQGRFPSRKSEESFLREILLREMEDATTGSQGGGLHSGEGPQMCGSESRAKASEVIRVAQKEQLYVPTRDESEALQNASGDWAQAPRSRREREGADSPRGSCPPTPRGGLGLQFSGCPNSADGSKSPIQDRRGPPGLEDCNRSRRIVTQLSEVSGARPTQDRPLRGTRVASIAVKKRGGVLTYNLQVKRHPSFSVNGVLVHNCHYVKNLEAQRTLAFHTMIARDPPEFFVGLSGTPIKNAVPEWYSLLKLCWYGGGYPEFQMYSGGPYGFLTKFTHRRQFDVNGRTITKYEGLRNPEQLRALIKPVYIRRKTADVLTLPERVTREVLISESADFDAQMESVWEDYAGGKNKNLFASTKAVSALAKVKFTVEFVRELLSEVDRVIVFTDHRQAAEEIRASWQVGEAAMIRGDTPMAERAAIVERFEAGRIKVLVATIGAMSVGVNLTSCHHMVFNDAPWVPADMAQAEGRIHRIGQSRSCFYYYILASRVDQRIFRTLAAKRALLEKAT